MRWDIILLQNSIDKKIINLRMKKLLGIFIMMLLFACTPTDENEIPTLSVDLHSPAVSLEDLFSKVEIIRVW